MAGNQLNLKTKVAASSIIEVVIAMVVIVTVFTIAMMIFTNVQRLSLSAKKVKALGILADALKNAENAKELGKQSFTVDAFRIDQEITAYNNNSTLHRVDLVAYDQNQEKTAEITEVTDGQ